MTADFSPSSSVVDAFCADSFTVYFTGFLPFPTGDDDLRLPDFSGEVDLDLETGVFMLMV